MALTKNSGRPIVPSPAPGTPVPTQTAAVTGNVGTDYTWGDKSPLSSGGYFKLRLTLSSKKEWVGEKVEEASSAMGPGGPGGSICNVHNGRLAWSTKFTELPKLFSWPAIVPFKRQGAEYQFDEDGYPMFDKKGGLHLYWARPVSGLEGPDGEILKKVQLLQLTGDRTHIQGIDPTALIRVIEIELASAQEVQVQRMDPYRFLQGLQDRKGAEDPTFGRLQVNFPMGFTETLLQWVSEAHQQGLSGVLDIYVKDRLSMRKPTVVPHKYYDSCKELVELISPNGSQIVEYTYNWGNAFLYEWHPGVSLYEADESLLYSQEQSRKIAEQAVNAGEKTVDFGAEYTELRSIVADKLSNVGGNKWAIKAGVVPAKDAESCSMWDNITQWGDYARDIWVDELSKKVGVLKKPHTWVTPGDVFTEEHLEAMMANVGNYKGWLTACGKTQVVTPTPTPTPVVVTPVVTPEPTEAPKQEGPSTDSLLASFTGGWDFATDDEESGDEGYQGI